jgi:hypothetical protein
MAYKSDEFMQLYSEHVYTSEVCMIYLFFQMSTFFLCEHLSTNNVPHGTIESKMIPLKYVVMNEKKRTLKLVNIWPLVNICAHLFWGWGG